VSNARVGSQRIYTGRIFNLDLDQVRFPDGSVGELEMIRHPGASAVLPFLTDPRGDDPQVLLIKQYRYAADGYLYEVPAGRLEAGELPIECARRELREETGCEADVIAPLTTVYTTPGFTDELIHLFMATGVRHGQAAREADEFMTAERMSLAQALELIRDGEIRDAKTIVCLLYSAGFVAGR
jgi:ADP-ribose pyrophosphatase